jgi:hypothetical protein
VRLEEESRKAKPRRRGADLRIPTEGSRRTERRSAESNSTPGYRRPPWARGVPEERPGLQRRRPPRDDQGQGDSKKF